MKKITTLGILLVAIFFTGAISAKAQDLNALLEAVEKIEANLKTLNKQVEALQSQQVVNQQTADLADLVAEMELLRNELHFLKRQKAAKTGLKLASTNNEEAMRIAFGQDQTAPEDNFTSELEITGFVDVVGTLQSSEDDKLNYSLGQAELDLGKALSERAGIAMAIAYNADDGLFELGAFELGINLHSSETGIQSLDITVGQFDVPFGIDFHEYASIDNKLVSGPQVCHYTHEGWNDVGFQIGFESSLANMVSFFVNGFESSAEVIDVAQTLATGSIVMEEIDTSPAQAFGTRVGFTPINHLELGGSFATGLNADNENEMLLIGADLQFGISSFEFKGEYIHHSVNRSIAEEKNQGYYVQSLYNFGPAYAVSRYGSFKPFEAEWVSQFSIGAGYGLMEGIELRWETLINENSDHNANMIQIVAGF